jgi:hypothetical protein
MRRAALAVVFGSTLAIAAVYAVTLVTRVQHAWGAGVFAVATAAMLVAFMVLGAARARARFGPLWLAFGFAFVVMAGGFLLALTLPADEAGARLYLGLPARAAIIVYGIGLLPAFVIPVAYALTFDRLTLSPEDLRRVRSVRTQGVPQRSGPEPAVHAAPGGDA